MGVRSSASFATHGERPGWYSHYGPNFFFVGSRMRRDENLRDIETVLNLHDQLTNTGWSPRH